MKKIKGYAKYIYEIKKCPICGAGLCYAKKENNLFVGLDGYSCMVCGTNFANPEGREIIRTESIAGIWDWLLGWSGRVRNILGKKKYPAIWEII